MPEHGSSEVWQPVASNAVVMSEELGAPTDLDVQTETPEAQPPPEAERAWWRWVDRAVIAFCIVGGIALRFVAVTPLWLDESLSVNISRLPLGQIPAALRHDGHPPLFYFLLHGWMNLFGQGDIAVRALSGVFAVALLPLMWIAGNRLGGRRTAWIATAVAAVCPFTIRYGTETRMYALVMLLALAGWLLVGDALQRPTWARLAGITALSAALLYSHYWGMWLLGAAAVGLLGKMRQARRAGDSGERQARVRVLLAMVAGGVLFIPWVPTLLYQGAHTGTPWGARVLPSGVIANTLADIGGGPTPEAVVFGGACAVMALVAIFCRPVSRRFLEVDLWTRPDARPLLYIFGATMALAMVAGYATQSTFVTRYTSVVFPFFILLVALGLSRFQWPLIARCSMVVLLALGTIGAGRTSYVEKRTQASADVQEMVKTIRNGDVIAYCPDQLGPSTSRELAGKGTFDQVSYPDFKPPQRVDWVDYTDRLNKASPRGFAQELIRRAGNKQIYVVWSDGYERTHHQACRKLIDALSGLRPVNFQLLPLRGDKYYEPSTVWLFPKGNP